MYVYHYAYRHVKEKNLVNGIGIERKSAKGIVIITNVLCTETLDLFMIVLASASTQTSKSSISYSCPVRSHHGLRTLETTHRRWHNKSQSNTYSCSSALVSTSIPSSLAFNYEIAPRRRSKHFKGGSSSTKLSIWTGVGLSTRQECHRNVTDLLDESKVRFLDSLYY